MAPDFAPFPDRRTGGNDWLVDGSRMSRVVRSMDWSRTPLGAIDTWPASLRTTVSLALSSNFPISLAWGPQHTQIYNDGYWPICGAKHPASMGQDFSECWASAFPVIGDAFHSALGGKAAFLEDQRMFLDRHGYLEETFFTFSFSPIRGESGEIDGLFHPVTETTGTMVGERRARALRDLSAGTVNARSMIDGLLLACEIIADYDLDVPFALFYQVDPLGGTAELVARTGLPAGGRASASAVDLTVDEGGWPLAAVTRTGAPVLIDDVRERFPDLICGPYPEPVAAAFVQPVMPPGHTRPVCVMVAGVSTRQPLTAAYRTFFDLLGSAVTTVIANAIAYQVERRRAEALAEIDRAKTTFFNNISHEFRTPLTLLLGPLEEELAAGAASLPPERSERLLTAHRNAQRLLRLVNTLLDFARMEDGRMQAAFEATDVATFTATLAGNFHSACEKAGLRLTVDCPALPVPVYVDRDMWEAIVLNLLSNAFKFTEQGGITVTVRLIAGTAELTVRDTGIGIPTQELSRVFERFHRVPGAAGRTHEGTGIGLSFVRELAGQHGGSVRVDSRPGQGSTFTVSVPLGADHLPAERIGSRLEPDSTGRAAQPFVEEAMRWLSDPDEPSARPGSTPASPAPEQRLPRIVWADDNADMRDYVRRILGSTYDVEAVTDGLAALEAVRRSAPELVLADVMMPRLDGLGLVKALRAEEATRTVPIVLLSAGAGEDSRIQGLAAGADDYLVKPFSARELLARVGAHVQLAQLRREAEVARSAVARAEALQASEAQLRLITDALPVLISYVDADRRFRFANRAYEEWIGCDHGDLDGKALNDVWGPATYGSVAEHVDLALSGQNVTYRSTVPDRDGATRILDVSYVPDIAPDGAVEGYFGLAVDVTERARAELEIRRLNEDLEERVVARTAELSAANEELRAFSDSVSHDLRSPLRAIDGFSEILLQDYADAMPAEAQQYFHRVRRRAQEMGQLIDALLALSKLGRVALSRQPIDTASLVQHCLDDVMIEYPGRQVEIAVQPLPACCADLVLLQQVWTNLLNNAVKYSSDRPIARITVGGSQNGGQVSFFCQDNGVGFDVRHADKLFGVFQRLHRAEDFAGLGVGLTIVQRIVRRHGGRIWAEADVDRGATFHFTLDAEA
jgi:PAS domain S-box-containing protein